VAEERLSAAVDRRDSNHDDPDASNRDRGNRLVARQKAFGSGRKEWAIANLLRGDSVESTFAALDEQRLRQLTQRLASASRLWVRGSMSDLSSGVDGLSDDLEDVEFDVSAPLLDAFLERIEAARREALRGQDRLLGQKPSGRFLLYRFDRTLETGESEIASRNFFDVRDRPPISLWLETLTRANSRKKGSFEVAVLVFIPEGYRIRAVAGREACPNGSLFFLDEVDGELSNQLRELVDDVE
jgi:hypothetical protein